MADNNSAKPAATQQNARPENSGRDQQPRQGENRQGGEIRRNNRNHRRRHGGQGQNQGQNQGQRQQRPADENRQRQPGDKSVKPAHDQKDKTEFRENRPPRDHGQKQNKKQNDGTPSGQNRFKRERRQRSGDEERSREPSVKKIETIDDIRSDNARITKEIYQVIASMKDITVE